MTVWWSRGYGGYYLPVGSHEVKPDGIDLLKQMGVLFKAASLKEIRVAGHADRVDGLSDVLGGACTRPLEEHVLDEVGNAALLE